MGLGRQWVREQGTRLKLGKVKGKIRKLKESKRKRSSRVYTIGREKEYSRYEARTGSEGQWAIEEREKLC